MDEKIQLQGTVLSFKTIQQLTEESSKITITDNQFKVMNNKYLRGDSPELLFRRIARNIALSELLHDKRINKEEIFSGCYYQIVDSDVGSKIYLLHSQNTSYSERCKNFSKFVSNMESLVERNPIANELVRVTEEKFYKLLSSFDFLPNSPTLMNSGRDLQQLSACYVLPVGDSIEEIYDAVKYMAIIHKSGGGTGFPFSDLRPSNDHVKTTKGVASGPLSFMRIFDTSTDVVKQGGTRRGANMGIMYYKHPDIRDFILSKSSDKGFLQNFNISVAFDAEFFDAVEKGKKFDLINPRSGEVVGQEDAQEIFDLMSNCAWESGDPGFIVIDRINNSDSNPTPHLGQIKSTNPCGEQPLLPFEPCNLGSINLSKFVKSVEGKVKIDYDRLGNVVFSSVHFLDNVIDINNYPLSNIEQIAKSNRRIGLGVMGWAEMLAKLEIPYDSPEAIELGEELMEFINRKAMECSEELAIDRGVFPNFRNSIFDENGPYFRGQAIRPRNCARTTIAPTGTIAITAGLQGGGIEPFFAIAYKRYQAEAIDDLKSGREPDEKFVFYEGVPLFFEIAEKNNWFGLEKTELLKKISDNHGSVKGINEIPERYQRIFVSSHDIHWKTHIDHQATFQKHINNAVSKTINLVSSATVEDIQSAYLYAYRTGCKGVTVYRDGCKEFQVLNTGLAKEKKVEEEVPVVLERDLSKGAMSDYYEIPTGYGTLHVNIAYDDLGPFRIFASIPPIGTEMSGLASVLSIFMSKAFQAGYDPKRAIKHLNSVKGDKPYGYGPNRIDSIPHAMAVALKRHLEKTELLPKVVFEEDTKFIETTKQEHCSKCYSPNVKYVSGCSEPTCFDCGYSKCS